MPKEMVTTALQRVFLAQPPVLKLVVHSDQGGQYCGSAYRPYLCTPTGPCVREGGPASATITPKPKTD